MKKLVVLIALGIFLLSFVAADISLSSEPKSLYNLNDKIELDVKILPNPVIDDLVILKLVCNEEEIEIYKEYLIINQELSKKIIVPLIKEFIKDSVGSCSIVSKIGDEKRTLSNTFTISNKLILSIDESSKEMRPGSIVSLIGTAVRENSKPASGVIEVEIQGKKIVRANSKLNEGKFAVEIPLADDFSAGSHTIKIRAYEKNKFDQITNEGVIESLITVIQVPTNLEIIIENKEIMPGESLIGVAVLRDQTGEKIRTKAYLAIKNEKSEVVKKIEVSTGEEFSYLIEETEFPNKFRISAYADEIISHIDFKILENKEVSINMINKTLIIKNIGNVYYNDTVYVSVGDEKVPVEVDLEVMESQKYNVYAPTGEYKIEFGGAERFASLTGNAIKIERVEASSLGAIKISAWIFIILILGFVAYIFFKKGNKKAFFGRKTGKKAKSPIELKEMPTPNCLINTKVKGELSISITGSRQNSPIGCISLKNYEQIKDGDGGVLETFSKIGELIESKKGIIYENKGHIFYILPPVRTKTFSNEIPIIKISEKIKELFVVHNKKFKQKIDFGIGLNYGTIVTREEGRVFKFMSMGTLMTIVKKIANRSNAIVLMNDKFKERLDKTVKVEKMNIENMNVFKFNSIVPQKDNSEFIANFLKKNKFN